MTAIGAKDAEAGQDLRLDPLSDERLVRRVLDGDQGAFAVLMRRYNQRLYRVVRGILRDEAETEDAIQEAYVRAYMRLGQLADPAAFGGWLLRIAANEAVERLRRTRHAHPMAEPLDETAVQDREQMVMAGLARDPSTPEEATATAEVRRLLERAIDALPEGFRTVFILRAVEQLSTAETAACLGLQAVTVKTRYFRAKLMLRKALRRRLAVEASAAFPFAGARCDRIVTGVLRRIADRPPGRDAADGDPPDGAPRPG